VIPTAPRLSLEFIVRREASAFGPPINGGVLLWFQLRRGIGVDYQQIDF
jgi:hypothetical protein